MLKQHYLIPRFISSYKKEAGYKASIKLIAHMRLVPKESLIRFSSKVTCIGITLTLVNSHQPEVAGQVLWQGTHQYCISIKLRKFAQGHPN